MNGGNGMVAVLKLHPELLGQLNRKKQLKSDRHESFSS
jgi:hypothetical protein